jgi:hypothetical protein
MKNTTIHIYGFPLVSVSCCQHLHLLSLYYQPIIWTLNLVQRRHQLFAPSMDWILRNSLSMRRRLECGDLYSCRTFSDSDSMVCDSEWGNNVLWVRMLLLNEVICPSTWMGLYWHNCLIWGLSVILILRYNLRASQLNWFCVVSILVC